MLPPCGYTLFQWLRQESNLYFWI